MDQLTHTVRRSNWINTVSYTHLALISGVPEEQILEVKQSEIGQKVKASIQKSGRNPALFKSCLLYTSKLRYMIRCQTLCCIGKIRTGFIL